MPLLQETCLSCHQCALGKTRTNLVFGRGNPEAMLMLIGEAPGEQEDLTGLPFVGAAGKLLDHYLTYVEINENDYYIANILKCRPPYNRDPLSEEEEICIGHLRAQTAIIRPKLIVCLGRIAAMRIIKPDFRITREHGVWREKAGVQMTAVYHPAALLRDPRKSEEMLLDMLVVSAKLKELKKLPQ
ncbi:MAG TPA: uracil-DNA glycosylase [Clostridiales bacterium]|nr:uracil-DNA glycosylase [Clostridiales bacterium]